MIFIGYSLAKTLEINIKFKRFNELRTIEQSHDFIKSEAVRYKINLEPNIYTEEDGIKFITLFKLIHENQLENKGLFIDFNRINLSPSIYLIAILVEKNIPFIDIQPFPHIPCSIETDFYIKVLKERKNRYSINAQRLGMVISKLFPKYKVKYDLKNQKVLVGKNFLAYIIISVKRWEFEIKTAGFFLKKARNLRDTIANELALNFRLHEIKYI